MSILSEAYRAGMLKKPAEVDWDDVKQDALDYALDNLYLRGATLSGKF